MDERGERSGRLGDLILDVIHGVTGIGMILLGLITFTDPMKHRRAFSVLFTLAALLCGLHILYLVRHMPRGRKDWGDVLITAAGIPLMLGMAALAYICMN